MLYMYIVEHVHTKCTTGRFMYDGSYGEEGVTGQVILTNNDLLEFERIACRNP